MLVQEIDRIEPRADENYFAMLTEPNREMTAQANLIIRHVPLYLPTIFRPGRLSPKLQAVRADRPDIPMPLFPRTIFIAVDVVEKQLGQIRSSPGMLSQPFMKFGEQFAILRPIGMAIIVAIEAKEREKYFSRKRKIGAPKWLPEVGDQVQFMLDEILGGLSGEVSDVDDKGRITILTEIMKRTVRVHATANQIEPV